MEAGPVKKGKDMLRKMGLRSRVHAMVAMSFGMIAQGFGAPLGFITNFESTNYWSANVGSTALSTTASQGTYSLAVAPSGYSVYTSSAVSMSGSINRVSIDLMLPAYPPNTSWKGDAGMYIDCPSLGVYSQYMGYNGFASLASNQWHTLTFTTPDWVVAAMKDKTYHDLVFKIVLNVPTGLGTHHLDNMKAEGQMLDIRVVAVVVGSDGSSGHTTDLYKTGFNRDSVIKAMRFLKDSWSQTGFNFLFNPKSDIVEVKSSQLNEDFPIQGGSLVLPLPPNGVDDFVNNANVVAQRRFADELGNVDVVYFRDAEYAWYNYTDADGNPRNALPAGAWSGLDHKYVRYPKGANLLGRNAIWPQLLTHEMGHYFSLAHTHWNMYGTSAEIGDSIKAKVDRGDYTKANITDHFDGDKGTGIGDTPADPGEFAVANANGGNKCGPIGTLSIPVNFSDGSSRTYSFTPLRNNPVSYYVECNDESSIRFTLNQTDKVRATASTDSRRKPLVTPLGIAVTAVFAPASADERQSFMWEYDPTRKNYDYIWGTGWRLSRLRTCNRGGVLRYSATWNPSTSDEFQVYNATYEFYRENYDTKWTEGYRLHDLSISVVDGTPRYTAVFRPSTTAEFQIYNATYEEYRAWYDQKWIEGYRLFLLEPYVMGNQIRYTAVVRPSSSAEFQVYNYAYADYRSWYDQKWNEGYRLSSLKVLRVPGQQPAYFAVVKPGTASEYQVYNWSYEDFRKRYDELSAQGWTLKSLSFYE